MAAPTLLLFVVTTAALAQTAMPPFLFDKFGLGRVQTETEGAPRVDSDVVYSRWTRSCHSGCLTRASGTLGGRAVIVVFLVEPEGDGRKTLYVWLPRDPRQPAGVRMLIDDEPPRIGAYKDCRPEGCVVEFTLDAAFSARLRTGRYLQIQGVRVAGQWTSYLFPLDDFAAATDRALINPAVDRAEQWRGGKPRTPPR
jgi:invasion protein IalB